MPTIDPTPEQMHGHITGTPSRHDPLSNRADDMTGHASRFFIEHGMVHDRKTGRHLVGLNHGGEAPEALLAVLRELENERDAWRMTAKAFDASQRDSPANTQVQRGA